ncbi:hypothetical protein B5807_02280 [Epicoccum nigrum]|uniref:Uncharacterized protein n=1 Tax=Epicoccum nigrum TaxID=105696 RepID=A0A1Y2M8G7_EPING|nr:hypothetical protein B5807_02280 [Epicoccum nigrum]
MEEEQHSSITPASVHGAQPEALAYISTPAGDDEPIESTSPSSGLDSLFGSPLSTPQLKHPSVAGPVEQVGGDDTGVSYFDFNDLNQVNGDWLNTFDRINNLDLFAENRINAVNWVNTEGPGNPESSRDQLPSQLPPQPLQPEVCDTNGHAVYQAPIRANDYMPSAPPGDLNESVVASNENNGDAHSNISTQGNIDVRPRELQVAEDNLRRIFAPELLGEATVGNVKRNIVDHTPTAGLQVLQAPRQTFRDMWPGQAMQWPLLAHEAGLAKLPMPFEYQVLDYPNEVKLQYHLPTQAEFLLWDQGDVNTFIQTFQDHGINVQWENLDGYFPNRSFITGPPQPFAPQPVSVRHEFLPAEFAGDNHVDITTTVQGGGLTSTHGECQPGQNSQQALSPALITPQDPSSDAIGGGIVDGAGEAPFGTQSNEVLSARQILVDWQSSKFESFEHKRDENMLTEDVASQLHDLVGRFSSQQAREDYLNSHDQTWHPPKSDATIPTSDEEMREVVTDLVFAMSSTEFAADSEANNALKTRWLPGKLFYNQEKIVLRCWQLAETAKNLHLKGPSALQCFDHKYAQSEFAKTKSWTFRERVDTMINLLATRKSRCDALMKGDQIDVFVAAPGKLLKTATQNAPNNAKKGEALKRGREAIKDEEDKAITSQTAAKSASTSQPIPVPTQNVFGRQVPAPARTSNLDAIASQRNTGLRHQPHPGFSNRAQLGTVNCSSTAWTPNSSFTTHGGDVTTDPESYGSQDLWDNSHTVLPMTTLRHMAILLKVSLRFKLHRLVGFPSIVEHEG